MDFIEKVNGPTAWVSPLVVVHKKTGDIRVGVYMIRANEAVVREQHHIPHPRRDPGGHVRSRGLLKTRPKVGISSDRTESRSLAKFMTHTGLWCYKRLMFGLSSAQET